MRIALMAVVCVVLLAAAHSALLADGFLSAWSETGTDFGTGTSWFGNTGLVLTPSAYTAPLGRGSLSYHWVDSDPDPTHIANLNFGITSGLELGGSWLDSDTGINSELVGNAKVRIPVEKLFGVADMPEVAFGAIDITDEVDRRTYIVLSKQMPLGMDNSRLINLSFGYSDSDSDIMNGFFGGITFMAMKNSIVNAEYDGKNFNADLRWGLSERVTVDVGLLDGDFGLGLTYKSGK